MKIETQQLLDRTFNFGVSCLKFISLLPQNSEYNIIKNQLVKSSTSIGANYEEAQAAESRKDFGHKIGIASKEARESHYWLRIIQSISDKNTTDSGLEILLLEALELKKIFVSIKLSTQNNIPKN